MSQVDNLLEAILPHVAFDGWGEAAFRAACEDLELSSQDAKSVVPRGAVDLAIAFHRRGDAAMMARLADTDLSALRFRDKVATALKIRLDVIEDREAVRRATTLFALPQYGPDGAKLVWETADHIWTAVGDTSRDGNWYSKRAILSGIWGATVLYWLGDDSLENQNTQAFIDRRIDNVMQFEKLKGQLRGNPLTKPLMQLHDGLFSKLKAPTRRDDVPGMQG